MNANLTNVDLTGVNLQDVDLTNADTTGTNIQEIELKK